MPIVMANICNSSPLPKQGCHGEQLLLFAPVDKKPAMAKNCNTPPRLSGILRANNCNCSPYMTGEQLQFFATAEPLSHGEQSQFPAIVTAMAENCSCSPWPTKSSHGEQLLVLAIADGENATANNCNCSPRLSGVLKANNCNCSPYMSGKKLPWRKIAMARRG